MSKRPTTKKRATTSASTSSSTRELTFGKDTYIWMGIGFGLILLGMLLMMGGHMPDNNTWDESIIYSTRRTVLAPAAILAGLTVEIYAIFKK